MSGPRRQSSSAACLARCVARRSRAPYLRRWALIIALAAVRGASEQVAAASAKRQRDGGVVWHPRRAARGPSCRPGRGRRRHEDAGASCQEQRGGQEPQKVCGQAMWVAASISGAVSPNMPSQARSGAARRARHAQAIHTALLAASTATRSPPPPRGADGRVRRHCASAPGRGRRACGQAPRRAPRVLAQRVRVAIRPQDLPFRRTASHSPMLCRPGPSPRRSPGAPRWRPS